MTAKEVIFILLLSLYKFQVYGDGACAEGKINYQGEHVKIINDCDLLKDNFNIMLGDLIKKPNCISRIVVQIGQEARPYSTGQKKNLHY